MIRLVCRVLNLTSKVNYEINYKLIKFENLTKHLYFLEGAYHCVAVSSRFAWYQTLTYNQDINKLQYYIKSGDRIITINNIQNTLQNKTCKINCITKSKVNTIRLINDKYPASLGGA